MTVKALGATVPDGTNDGNQAAYTNMPDGRPVWADVGMEVEAIEVSPGFEGAVASGELLEWLPALSGTCALPGCGHSSKCGVAPAVVGASATCIAESSARLQTRTALPPSPYCPRGRLVSERKVPLSRLRPRPPPPPAGFLVNARVGEQLQLRHEGMWWDVTLLGVAVHDAAHDEAPPETQQATHRHTLGGGNGHAEATATEAADAYVVRDAAAGDCVAAAGVAKEGATKEQLTSLVPRYRVASGRHADIGGEVAASELRPRWEWTARGWLIEERPRAAEATGAAEQPTQARPAAEAIRTGSIKSEVLASVMVGVAMKEEEVKGDEACEETWVSAALRAALGDEAVGEMSELRGLRASEVSG